MSKQLIWIYKSFFHGWKMVLIYKTENGEYLIGRDYFSADTVLLK